MRFLQMIPQPHRQWWSEWGLDFDLFETRATCSSCIMAPQTYDAQLKCCTFFPEVPNFVWSHVSQKFATPLEGVLAPRGLSPASSYRDRYVGASFGQQQDLLCPFFKAGGCGIWEHRPAPCVRFICQSSYGEAGQKVWAAAESLMRLTEETLAHDVLLRLGFDVDEIASEQWFEFVPDDVFARAGEIVAGLSANEVWDLLQPEATQLREELCQAASSAIGSRV